MVEPSLAVSEIAPRQIARFGATNIWAAVLNAPWQLPVDAFVIPTGPTGDLEGGLAQRLREVAGSDWSRTEKLYEQARAKNMTFGPGEPWLLEVNIKETKARFFIFATGISGNNSLAGQATEAIVGLCRHHKIADLGLPLLGSGRAKVASSEAMAEAMLRALTSTVHRSPLQNVYITTLSSGAFARLRNLAWEIAMPELPRGRRLAKAARTSTPAAASNAGPASPPAEPPGRQPQPEGQSSSVSDDATAGTSRRDSSFRPAAALVADFLTPLGAQIDEAARQLVAQAGHVAFMRYQHDEDGRALTTSTFLFAMVEQGRRGDDGPPAAPLQLFASAVTARTEGLYSSQLSKFVGEPLKLDFGEAETLVAAMTPNVQTLLTRAVAIQREAGTNVVGTAALALALLEHHGEFAKQLLAMGLTRDGLQSELTSALQDLLRRPEPLPPAQPDALANFWTDNPNASAEDYLDVKKEVEAFARLAANKEVDPPLSIGVFGEWGSGKTFFMERMYDRIEELTTAGSRYQKTGKFHGEIVQIRFNAWHYIETNLWASLVEFIFFELDRWLTAHDTPRSKIDALFDQLATSKQLRLDAVRDLLASRSSLSEARAELTEARENYDKAVKDHSVAGPADVVDAVWDEFTRDASNDQQLKTAAADLGVRHLGESVDGLRALVNDTREQGARARLLGQSLMARLSSPPVAIVSILAILAVPIVIEGLRYAVAEASPWLKGVNGGVLAFTSALGTAILTGRALLGRGIEGLNALDRLRTGLERRIAEKTRAERDALTETEKRVSERQQAVSEAEHKVASAAKLAAAAELEYANDTSRGRLNKFIREKVADGSYAKHLGIIATIRKDFDQLASIMNAETSSKDAEEEFKAARQLYRSKLLALIKMYDVRKTKLLKLRELQELADKPKRDDLPFFRRIILYIDDLDRCPPEKVTEVLQAIHMLLFFPLFVVVVAVDARWIARSLETEFPHLLREADKPASPKGTPKPPGRGKPVPDVANSAHGSLRIAGRETATAQDYLEKIFQIPFWVRRMDHDASKAFVKGLASRRRVDAESPTLEEVGGDVLTRTAETIEPKPNGEPGGAATDPAASGTNEVDPGQHSNGKTPNEGTSPADVDPAADSMIFEVASFTPEEIGLLEELAPFIGGSPRRAKRFVNLYHLLRTTLRDLPLVSKDVRLHRRALIAALAVVTGAPHSASTFFNGLLPRTKDGPYPSLGEVAARRASGDDKAADANSYAILTRLSEINENSELNEGRPVSNGPDMTQALSLLSDTVRRYSFEMVK